MKYFLVFLLLNIFVSSYGCESVCSLNNLEKMQEEQNKYIIRIINDLFNGGLNEDVFFTQLTADNNYDDLFIFKYSVSSL